jgi:hypothetical protein
VPVEPLKRRVAETERVGRGALRGKAPSLFGARLLVLPACFEEELALRGGSLGDRAGGDITVPFAVGAMEEMVTGVLSVAVVGGPMA